MLAKIAVLNQKGGVGKTTTAVNAAAYIAKSKQTVLVADCDPQGNATSGLGIVKANHSKFMYDFLVEGAHFNEVAVPIRTTRFACNVIPANEQLAGAEVTLANAPNREFFLKKALEKAPEHDYVFIDCPPSLGLLTVNALAAATHVLIPVQAEYYALEGLSQLLSVLQYVQDSINPNIELLGVVVTMYDGRTSLAEGVYAELKKHFGAKLFQTVIPRNVRLAEAPSYGKAILEHDKWSKGARAYKQLAKEIQQRVENKK